MGDNFVTSCLCFCTPSPFYKGSTLKEKNLLPVGANSFLLELTPFRVKAKTNLSCLPLMCLFSPYGVTLKTPRKPASENVICLCRLLNILANFSNLFLYIGKQRGP